MAENNAPIARDVQLSLAEDSLLRGQLPMATDADGDAIVYSASGLPGSGVLTVEANGSFSYAPEPNFNGRDEFQYQVSDGRGGINHHVVRINVTPLNDAPQVLQGFSEVRSAAAASASWVLAPNAFFDIDGDTLSYSATRADGSPLPAWLRFDAATQRFKATPSAQDEGTVAIRVVASDGNASATLALDWLVQNLPARSLAISAAHGALQGAALYIDNNGNQQPELFEDTGLRSDANGRFEGNVFGDGTLMMVGGFDVISGAPNTLQLSAPAGASVLSPLTTLVQAVMRGAAPSLSLTSSAAQAAVKTTLGLPASFNLLTDNPATRAASDGDALLVQRAASQLAALAAALDDTDAAIGVIAAQVNAGNRVDLANLGQLQNLFASADVEGAQVTASARGILAMQSATTVAAVLQAQSVAMPAYRAWNPALEPATELVNTLLAPGAGLVLEAGSTRVQYGLASEPHGAAEHASLGITGGKTGEWSLGRGLILSTGDSTPPPANTQVGYGLPLVHYANAPALQDAQLLAAVLAGFPGASEVQDVSYLSFNFSVSDAAQGFVHLDLVFGSDEYPEFSDSPYADIAAVFVNGVNLALFNGQASQPLSIVERSFQAGRFQDNSDGHLGIEYDAMSRAFTLTAPVVPGLNSLKIAIGDTGDPLYDSALLVANLRAASFGSSGLRLTVKGTPNNDVTDGTPADDFIDGGAGVDVLRYSSGAAVQANLAAGTVTRGGESDVVTGFEGLIGSAFADTLIGANGLASALGESFRPGGGNDSVDGGAGVDTVEFSGPRSAYTLVRNDAHSASPAFSVTHKNTGADGVDQLSSIERLRFADTTLAFGARAEEVARLAFVLWSPAVANNKELFAQGIAFYDQGLSFQALTRVALGFWPVSDAELAAQLVRNVPGTSRTAAELLQLIAGNGGGEAGRSYATELMANEPQTQVQIELVGFITNGIECALTVAGQPYFALMPG